MTLFERLITREIPADIVHEDEQTFAFRDIHPQAPIHVLIVPKRVIPRVGEAELNDQVLLGALLLAAGLRIKRFTEFHDVHAALAQCRADWRCRFCVAGGDVQVDIPADLFCHVSFTL